MNNNINIWYALGLFMKHLNVIDGDVTTKKLFAILGKTVAANCIVLNILIIRMAIMTTLFLYMCCIFVEGDHWKYLLIILFDHLKMYNLQ